MLLKVIAFERSITSNKNVCENQYIDPDHIVSFARSYDGSFTSIWLSITIGEDQEPVLVLDCSGDVFAAIYKAKTDQDIVAVRSDSTVEGLRLPGRY